MKSETDRRKTGRETLKNAASHERFQSRSWLAFITPTERWSGLDSITAVTSWTALQSSGRLRKSASETEIGVEESESCGHLHLAIEGKKKTKQTRTRVLESRTLYEPWPHGNLTFVKKPAGSVLRGDQRGFQGKERPQLRDLVRVGRQDLSTFEDSIDFDRGIPPMVSDASGELGRSAH